MEVTCLIVSHDTLFLDNVVTDIIHYETVRLLKVCCTALYCTVSSFSSLHNEHSCPLLSCFSSTFVSLLFLHCYLSTPHPFTSAFPPSLFSMYQRKLVYYHGNLTHFVEIHPEAKYYYELESSTLVFKFPTPERLDGIASTTRSVSRFIC